MAVGIIDPGIMVLPIRSTTRVFAPNERDLALDYYVIQSGPFNGVALGWRHSTRSQVAPAQDLNRLVVTYTLALF